MKFKTVGSAKYNTFKKTQREPLGNIDTQVVNRSIFLGMQGIEAQRPAGILWLQLHDPTHVIEFPDTQVSIEIKVTVTMITPEQASVTIADEHFIIAELEVKRLGCVEKNRSTCIKIIVPGFFKRFVQSSTGHCPELLNPVTKVKRRFYLIFCNENLHAEFT